MNRFLALFFSVAVAFCAAAEEPCPTCDEKDDAAGGRMFLAEAASSITLRFYYDPACRKCRDFLEREIPAGLRVVRVDCMSVAGMDELRAELVTLGITLREFPVSIIEGHVFQGLAEARAGLPTLLSGAPDSISGAAGGAVAGSGVVSVAGFTVAALVAAALIDGVNPCAFSTILFLVSLLTLTGRKKKELLFSGGVFCLTVFLGYSAAGFGLYRVFRSVPFFASASNGFKLFLATMLAVFSAMSIYDAYVFSRGRTTSAVLKMPSYLRRKIHDIARGAVRGPALFVGLVVLGLTVTVFEFSCTGQVYLPVIMHLARTGSDGRAIGLLLLYNAIFLIPLASVFAVGYFGLTSRKVEAFFRGRLAQVKLAAAAMFAIFAVLTLLV